MLQARGIMLVLNHNIIPMSASQLSTGLSLSIFPRETAEALQTFAAFLGKGGKAAEAFQSFATFLGEGAERGGPEAFADFEIGLHKRGLGRAVTGKHAGTRTPARSAGPVGSSTGPPKRRRKPTLFGPVKFLRPLYRSPGSPSFSPVDEGLGLQVPHGSGGARRSHAPVPLHAGGRSQNPQTDGRHEPVVELRAC